MAQESNFLIIFYYLKASLNANNFKWEYYLN